MKSRTRHYRGWLGNLKVKLISLLSALFLWFYVVTDNHFNQILRVTLKLVNQPEDQIPVQPIPHEVKVRIRGTGKDLLSLTYREKRIEIDLQQAGKTGVFPLTLNMLKGVPEGSSIEPLGIVEPETVYVDLDRFASRKVPVRSDLTLVPLDGYMQVGSVRFEPDSILVRGPQSLVSQISEVVTISKEYSSLPKTLQDHVPIVPPAWQTVHYSEHNVRFTADIQRIGERVMADIPVLVTHVPRGVKVNAVPSLLSLKLQGGVKVLAGLTEEDIQATIDYRSRYRYRGNRIPANIEVPPGVTFSESKPKAFELVVER